MQEKVSIDFIIDEIVNELFDTTDSVRMDTDKDVLVRKVTILLNYKIVEKAREHGINISFLCNGFLEKYIERFEQFLNAALAPGVGFEPTRASPNGLAGRRLTTRQPRLLKIKVFEEFKSFV